MAKALYEHTVRIYRKGHTGGPEKTPVKRHSVNDFCGALYEAFPKWKVVESLGDHFSPSDLDLDSLERGEAIATIECYNFVLDSLESKAYKVQFEH